MAVQANIPSKIQHPETINMSLVVRRRMYPMNGRLEEVARQSLQRIANIDRDRFVLRLDPFPLALRIQDLQRSNRLTEQKRNAPEISVARRVELADLSIELWRTSGVVHVPKMIFAFHIVDVVFD